jgi:2-amino-4-hydroxy-6-hydroxymethyldihydropteridine diphosphokinase
VKVRRLPESASSPHEKIEVLCVLGLGSNRPYKGLSCADIIITAAGDLRKILSKLRLSPLYKTVPLYVEDQEPFINAVAAGFFCIDKIAPNTGIAEAARSMLKIIQNLEAFYGRDRSLERRRGERSLDIDILLFGDLVLAEDDLTVPHPGLKERAFALRPLLDLLPETQEPATGKKYRGILDALPFQEIVPLPELC